MNPLLEIEIVPLPGLPAALGIFSLGSGLKSLYCGEFLRMERGAGRCSFASGEPELSGLTTVSNS